MSKQNFQKARGRMEEQKEFEEAVLQIDRVTRVVKGGRRLRFRVTVAIGDKRGRVGMGIGKATEVVNGIKKAVAAAKKALVRVSVAEGDTIPHPLEYKYKAVHFKIIPASPGTGVIAGGALRKILGLAGIKNVLSKNFGSRNSLVMAQASIRALASLAPAKKPAQFKEESRQPKAGAEAQKEQRRKEDVRKRGGRPGGKNQKTENHRQGGIFDGKQETVSKPTEQPADQAPPAVTPAQPEISS